MYLYLPLFTKKKLEYNTVYCLLILLLNEKTGVVPVFIQLVTPLAGTHRNNRSVAETVAARAASALQNSLQ